MSRFRALAECLSMIAVDPCSRQRESGPFVPSFVIEFIEDRQSSERNSIESFFDIVETLKQNYFKIIEGIDSDEVPD
jgi:hypothetical protein